MCVYAAVWLCVSILYLSHLYSSQGQSSLGVLKPPTSPVAQLVKNLPAMHSIPVLGTSPAEERGYPLQYSGLENAMDCIVHGVAKSWTTLSDFHFHIRLEVILFFFFFEV